MDVQKQVCKDLIELHGRYADRLSSREFAILLTKFSKTDVETGLLKQELLEKYSQRDPKKFLQIDCWRPKVGDTYYYDLTGGITHELMASAPLRILIREDDRNDPEVLAKMLETATHWVRRGAVEDIHRGIYEPCDFDEEPAVVLKLVHDD